jgi:hypothetical protein
MFVIHVNKYGVQNVILKHSTETKELQELQAWQSIRNHIRRMDRELKKVAKKEVPKN